MPHQMAFEVVHWLWNRSWHDSPSCSIRPINFCPWIISWLSAWLPSIARPWDGRMCCPSGWCLSSERDGEPDYSGGCQRAGSSLMYPALFDVPVSIIGRPTRFDPPAVDREETILPYDW